MREERNIGLLVPAAIFLGLSPVALIGGSAMVLEGKGEDKDIGVALQVVGGVSLGFGLAGTIAGALAVPVEVDPQEASVAPVVRVGVGNVSVGWRF